MGKLKFTIDASGEVSVEVQEVIGPSCEDLSRPFETALGTLANRQHQDSFYATAESASELTTGETAREEAGNGF